MAKGKTIFGSNYDRSAFQVRQPKMKPWHLGLIGAVIAGILLFSTYNASSQMQSLVIILMSIGVIGIIYIVQNSGFDDRTATEFQCLVFSGSMRSNTMLTVILYRDGSIFYLDPRYAQTFSKGSAQHNLDMFLSTIGLENNDKLQVYDAIKDLKRAEFEYTYTEGKKANPLKIGIYPILRPEGFICLTVQAKA